jgi:hypothetical protein
MSVPATTIQARGKRAVFVKIRYDDQIKRVAGTAGREEHGPGSLVVYNGTEIVARFIADVEKWWTEE